MTSAALLIGLGLASSHLALGQDTTVSLERATQDEEVAFVQKLLDQAKRDEPESGWFRDHLRDPEGSPNPIQAELLHQLIREGSLGDRLRRATDVQEVSKGPDYVRVILDGEPGLSITLNQPEESSLSLRSIEFTSCSNCTEPERFVKDLIWTTSLGSQKPILTPSVDLFLRDFLEENPSHDSHWVAMLHTRNHKAKLPQYLLRGAQVLEVNGDTLSVQYSTGFIDTWTPVYQNSGWALDYRSLRPDSPLRMNRKDMWRWREPNELRAWALQRWEPNWKPVLGGLGVQVGSQAIGVAIDPLDDTILIVTSDMDRILGGIFRVDPYRFEVISRQSLPPSSSRTSIPIDRWYERWFFELSADRSAAIVYLPNRLWLVDLTENTQQLLDSPNRVTALAVDSSDSRSRRLVAAATRNSITIYGGDGLQYLPIPAPIKELTFANQGLVAVTETGEVIEFILTELNSRSAGSGCCENGIQEAALHPSGDEVLLVCHPSCEHPWERVSLEKNDAELIPGSSVESLGLSWSPNGDQYITAASNGGLLLWSASYNQPLAEFNPPGKTLETHWTADGSALVSRNSAGEVYWWNLEMIQIKKGLH